MLDTLSSQPLVVGAEIESAADVDEATARLAAVHGDVAFLAVVAADDEAHLALILDGFRRHLAEMIFTASTASTDLVGDQAAWLALERHGVGQDFVFTVADLADAMRYALQCLTEPRLWTGAAILVLGNRAVIDEARIVIDQQRSGRGDRRR